MLNHSHCRDKGLHTVCELIVKSAFQTSPCRENWGQSRMTGHFESLHSCNSPAAAPAPASGQRSGSSWPHHRRRLQPGCLGAGWLPAPQTAAGRGCGWGEDAAASHRSSGRGVQKWRKRGGGRNDVKRENYRKENGAGEWKSRSNENGAKERENEVREHSWTLNDYNRTFGTLSHSVDLI